MDWEVWRALEQLELISAIASSKSYASFVLSKLRASLRPRPNDRNKRTHHSCAQHVACVWPPCCDMLRRVALTIFTLEATTSNMSQHITTRWPNAHNMLSPTMLRYVALACCDRLAGAYLNICTLSINQIFFFHTSKIKLRHRRVSATLNHGRKKRSSLQI